jgi:hypothetical protein
MSENSDRRRKKKRDKERRTSDPDEAFGFDGHQSSTSGFGDAFGDFASAPKTNSGSGWPTATEEEGHSKGADVWGDPSSTSGWGGEATGGWGTSAPTVPSFSAGGFDEPQGASTFGHNSGGFGENADAFGGGFGSGTASFGTGAPWEKRPSDTGNGGGWGSDSSANHPRDMASSHRDRHAGSSASSHSVVAHLQIRRPYNEIEHNIKGFERNFIESIAAATGIDRHRINIKDVRRGY